MPLFASLPHEVHGGGSVSNVGKAANLHFPTARDSPDGSECETRRFVARRVLDDDLLRKSQIVKRLDVRSVVAAV
eukprot:4112413-Prymnesium_polylepis.1